jgi:hypothetical protein
MISAAVVIESIVGIAGYVGRIITATVVVGIIVVDIAWTDGQRYPLGASMTWHPAGLAPRASTGLLRGWLGPGGVAACGEAEKACGQQAR